MATRPQTMLDPQEYPVAARGPFYGVGPKGYRRPDARVFEDVCELVSESDIDASDVEVAVEQGTVVLRGTVDTRGDKRTLEAMIEHVHGVSDVRNELHVRLDPRFTHLRPSLP